MTIPPPSNDARGAIELSRSTGRHVVCRYSADNERTLRAAASDIWQCADGRTAFECSERGDDWRVYLLPLETN